MDEGLTAQRDAPSGTWEAWANRRSPPEERAAACQRGGSGIHEQRQGAVPLWVPQQGVADGDKVRIRILRRQLVRTVVGGGKDKMYQAEIIPACCRYQQTGEERQDTQLG